MFCLIMKKSLLLASCADVYLWILNTFKKDWCANTLFLRTPINVLRSALEQTFMCLCTLAVVVVLVKANRMVVADQQQPSWVCEVPERG